MLPNISRTRAEASRSPLTPSGCAPVAECLAFVGAATVIGFYFRSGRRRPTATVRSKQRRRSHREFRRRFQRAQFCSRARSEVCLREISCPSAFLSIVVAREYFAAAAAIRLRDAPNESRAQRQVAA